MMLYVHIPFCTSKCIYCDFYSVATAHDMREAYVDAVMTELHHRWRGGSVRTVYVGGGTPSALPLPLLRRLLMALPEAEEEFTVECNPDDITPELARTLVECGVNRVSMGVQTFSDDRLRFLRRRHSAAQILPAVECLRRAGVGNISIDLMFGFPGETMAEWQTDLQRAVALGVEHLSAYSLMYEEGTPLTRMMQEGRVEQLDDTVCREMYDTLIDTLHEAGYEQYEISNFCKAGWHSRHNSGYWSGEHYIGIGAAAHSYDGTCRSWNVSDVGEYVRNPLGVRETEALDEDTRYNDLITTRMRTRRGVCIEELPPRYRQYIISEAQRAIMAGCLALEDGYLRLTRKGLYVSDDVMSDLVFSED